ncbi:hypothetical protein AGMMS49546_19500 [Spirochaetia bacterium]|nr:hypothetical protein AGMMS49546_19500 [Spirochaetia bacterium]
MINLKLSGLAAVSGFILSLLIGIASGGGTAISLIRSLFCGLGFFALSSGIWVLINRFIPEILVAPPREEDNLLMGASSGSRVNISVEDENIPEGAVIPEEDRPENDMGNIADLVASGGPMGKPTPQPAAPPPPPSPPQDDFPWEPMPVLQEVNLESFTPDSLMAPPIMESPAPRGGAGMDQNAKESYTRAGTNMSSGAGASSDAGFTVSPSPLPFSGAAFGDEPGLETLPDLDAMAGAFMSSDDGGEEEPAPPAFPAERKILSTNKGQAMGGDYRSKDLASAIQTILKKD